jgi:hypothetical protein
MVRYWRKKMKKLLIIAVGIILVSTSFLSGCIQTGEGTLVLQITDAPGDLNITEALVTISSIKVHLGSGGNNSTAGWYTIVDEQQTFDLIAIKDVKEFLGEENLSSGIYTQIRLNIDKALVTINGTQYNLTIPSKNIKLIKAFWINNSETTILTLDFDVNESVHKTGNDKYIFKPTIKVIQE